MVEHHCGNMLRRLKSAGLVEEVAGGSVTSITKLVKDCKERIANREARQVPLPSSTKGSSAARGSSSFVSYGDYTRAPTTAAEGKKRRAVGGAIEKSFQNESREECNGEIARMFYTSGLSFNLARNPHYRNSYFRVSTLSGYVPPGYNAIRTTLLANERKNLENQLMPLKFAWRDKGVSICSDGWSDAQRRPLINVIAVCESGPMMLKAVNCEGEYKDHQLIANLFIDSIKQVSYENVVQVVTDNAHVCSKVGALIAIMFSDHCNLKLLSVALTKFASTFIMLKRFKTIKNGLQQMVISTKWDDYRENDYRKAGRVKEMLLDDLMWDNIDHILSFTEPIYEMIKKADTDKPCLHLVYEWWDSMMEQVKKAIYRKEMKQIYEKSSFWDAVHKILLSHWSKDNTPLHCLAHSLNPNLEWLDEDSHRVAPHKDLDVTREKKNCFLRYFTNEDDRRNANIEYDNFSVYARVWKWRCDER
uniref:uncharacterized protein LOC101312950 n=1 Tax=Fragaria vesca subsp. vesca TaxID=101020 RepID=UPI0005C7FC11|nr:PREDICTED: uncharacterized protein LOC101312950 [Fragaria vesca subsp. vesca]